MKGDVVGKASGTDLGIMSKDFQISGLVKHSREQTRHGLLYASQTS